MNLNTNLIGLCQHALSMDIGETQQENVFNLIQILADILRNSYASYFYCSKIKSSMLQM